MRGRDQFTCLKQLWRGREAYMLGNGLVQIVSLSGGGHIAEFRFTEASGLPDLSPFWVPPWKTIEPYQYRPALHAKKYGPPETGKLIAGIAGHNLCLDYFGSPSAEEAAQGLSIHGEAPSAKWRKAKERVTARQVSLTLAVQLPVAGLEFRREITLRRGESVAYFEETVRNQRKADHFFHWTQHATLAPPFLAPRASRVAISATKGRTSPYGYEGKALLASARDFHWPFAPSSTGGKVDLSRPFLRRGRGILATCLLDPGRDIEFVTALNVPHGLLVGYCFCRQDFPWVAIWEENCARKESPWNGHCQSRGLEFGSTPFPFGRREAFALAPLFGTPTFSTVAARGSKTARYVLFLAQVPQAFDEVRDIRLAKGEILIQGGRKQVVRLPASGLAAAGLVAPGRGASGQP